MKTTIPSILRNWIPPLLLLLVALLWKLILKDEFIYVFIWWSVFLVMGLMFFPLSVSVFSTFTDKGYMFSKVLGLAITSYIVWILSFFKLLRINTFECWAVVIGCGVIVYILFFRKSQQLIKELDLFWILTGESLFLFSLGFWAYLRGFNPKIEGLEKFMDYGFVNSIIRSGFVPPKDMWFAGESINYYYLGQYITAFVTRLSNIKTDITYNLMMATLFAFSMVLCFTIVTNLLKGYGLKKDTPIITGGLIASVLVSLGGNLHSFIYGTLSKLTAGGKSYWFPDATRYIGYNPETRDKTIHEFPVYSFVVSDLHAHVINMSFVLTLLGVLYAILKKYENRANSRLQATSVTAGLFLPELVIPGFLIGIFQMSNYWDFPIYLTVTLFTLLCIGIRQNDSSINIAGITIIRFSGVLVLSLLFAFPFNLTFQKVSNSIRLAQDHSYPYQLLVLWGYQLFFVSAFFVLIFYAEQNLNWIKEVAKKRKKPKRELGLITRIVGVLKNNRIEDIFAVILCISAVGLVIIPELVYVEDIYSAEHKRANTMFKLTYQAFIMFGLAVGYIFIRIRQFPLQGWIIRATRILAVIMIALPMVYPFYAIPSWYKKMDPDRYEGLDGLKFLQDEYPDDYELVQWLRENIEGQPTILEADGDSYTMYGRISSATGIPTVQGWFVHEWLWRDDVGLVQERVNDVKTIYESDDLNLTMELLQKYQVEYIVIGKLERERFAELKHDKLLGLGTVVFEKPTIQLIKLYRQ